MSTAEIKEAQQSPAARNYMAVCLAALVLILLVQVLEQDLTYWTLIPFVVGGLGLITRWSSAPLMLILALAGFQFVLGPRDVFGRYILEPAEAFQFSDLILCGAVLAYTIAHYRLQALIRNLFPEDPCRPQGRLPRQIRLTNPGLQAEVVPQRRSYRAVPAGEFAVLILTVLIWAVLAQICWYILPTESYYLDLSARWWRALVLGWLIGLSWLVIASLVGYLGLQAMKPDEAALFLQDTLWRETRREQRRPNRWLAWARLRQRRKENR